MKKDGTDAEEMLVISRVFDAPREVVWKAWTDPKYVKQWMGPKGFSTPIYKIDFRVGGKFHFCMKTPDGQEFWSGGQYYEIVPMEKIVYSMYFSDAEGNQVDPETLGIVHESVDGARDMVTFEDLGNGKTRFTLYGNEPMESAKNSGQLEGWTEGLDKMAAFMDDLAKGKISG